MDLLGDGERLVAGERVFRALVAVPGQGEGSDCGDVGGVDRGSAAGTERVEHESSLADRGQPVEGVRHEAGRPQDRGGNAAGADHLLALVVPAAHGGHRVADDSVGRQEHDAADAGGLRGGDGVGGVGGADAW
jgi:hypothetical protein